MTRLLKNNNNNKIALYASSAVNRGGTGVYTARLIEGFKSAGFSEVVPVGLDLSAKPYQKFVSEHFTLPRKIRKEKYKLLHLPAFGGGIVSGLPYVVTVHDMAFLANPNWFSKIRSLYYRYHFPRVAKGAAAIISDSEFTRAEVKKYLHLDSERVYLSAPINNSNDSLFRSTFNITGSYILSTGTIEPRKNIDALLKAWPLINSKHRNLTLVVVGRWGWGKKTTIDLLKNTSGVRWLGALSGLLLQSAFAGAKLLVYPSLYEGFGLPPLESAASGVPFVIGPAETLSEIYGQIAAATTDSSSTSIAENVLSALEIKPEPDKLRHFASGFSHIRMAENTYRVYQKVLK